MDTFSLKNVTRQSIDYLKCMSDSPELDVSLIMTHVTGLSRTQQVASDRMALTDQQLCEIGAYLKRRGAGEPMAYIIGAQEFYGRKFMVSRSVLIPRPETELLIDTVKSKSGWRPQEARRVLDVGTGSGCVGITFAIEYPNTAVVGWDICDQALRIASENAERLGARNITFERADALDAAPWRLAGGEKFDAIVANPPYIAWEEADEVEPSVMLFEPAWAVFIKRGVEFYETIACQANHLLGKGGIVAVEIGSKQAAAVRQIFARQGWSSIEVIKDLSGHDRVVFAVRG